MRPEHLKGHLDALVMAVLAEKPAHGYAIMDALHQRSSGAVDIEGGTLYPVLHRLEEAGLIAGSWTTAGGRRRRTYTMTPAGRKSLTGERARWKEFVSAVGSIMTTKSQVR